MKMNLDSCLMKRLPSIRLPLFAIASVALLAPLYLASGQAPANSAMAHLSGGVIFQPWNCSAQFKDVVIKKGTEVLYASDNDKEFAQWEKHGETWSASNGILTQSSESAGGSWAELAGPAWTDYTMTLMLKREAGIDGVEILVGCNNGDSSQIRWSLGCFRGAQDRLYKKTPEGDADLDIKDGTFPATDWKPVKVDMSDGKLRCYYDNILIHEVKIADIVAAKPKH